ncbi:MAG: ABC transporter substrate-binding protein [Syntrophales bacterium]|jgi:ABC-type branched-subunit amino acid transport system substrate-binding protein|nr:ABC transporter substrate-binding protein [Syntrophales bacterium]MDY0045097.1 ABC transporter substrate-binding protein [Syntrophales bacterium]
MKKKIFCGMAAVILAFLIVIPLSYAAPKGFDDKEIRIGQWGPQTGPAAPWGSVARGSKLLFDIVNEEGGINGRQIKYFIRDDQYNPSQTKLAVKELVERKGVFAFVGGVGSSCGLAVKDYLSKNKVIWVGPCSGAEDFFEPVDPYVWVLWPPYEDDSSILTKYAVEKMNFKKIGFFYQNDSYGKDGLDAAKYRLETMGLKLVEEVPVEPTEKDLSSQMAKFQAAGAEAIIAFISPVQAAIALKTCITLGYHPQWLHSYNLSDYLLMNMITGGLWAKEGVITSGFTETPYSDSPLMVKYREAAKRLAPEERWAIFYMAGIVVGEPLVWAMKEVGQNLSTEAVKQKLDSISNFKGIGPPLNWTAENHRGPSAVVVWKCGPNAETILLQDWAVNEIPRYKK